MINIVNLSFTTGIFPEFCKKDCVNYRPILILPIYTQEYIHFWKKINNLATPNYTFLKLKQTKYGLNSLQFSAASLWNNFSRVHPKIIHIRNTHSVKSSVEQYAINNEIQFIKFTTCNLLCCCCCSSSCACCCCVFVLFFLFITYFLKWFPERYGLLLNY